MKKNYKRFEILGTFGCLGSLIVLIGSVLTIDWVEIQEPQLDNSRRNNNNYYEELRPPHLLQTKFGLFRMCFKRISYENINKSTNSDWWKGSQQTLFTIRGGGPGTDGGGIECIWYNFGIWNFQLYIQKSIREIPTPLIGKCIDKLRFTLPFIIMSLIFTSISFFCITFGHFCQKNKKIAEASLLILGGLCQATALLTFVVQIGSEFESNPSSSTIHSSNYNNYSRLPPMLYRYKYGYSFYLFLLSFGLSELGAFFDLIAYFRKYPPANYVITFHRQDPSPFGGSPQRQGGIPFSSGGGGTLGRDRRLGGGCRDGDELCKNQGGGPDLCNDFNNSSESMGYPILRIGGDDKVIPPPQSYINPEVTITTIESGLVGVMTNTRGRATNTLTMQSFGTLRKENNV